MQNPVLRNLDSFQEYDLLMPSKQEEISLSNSNFLTFQKLFTPQNASQKNLKLIPPLQRVSNSYSTHLLQKCRQPYDKYSLQKFKTPNTNPLSAAFKHTSNTQEQDIKQVDQSCQTNFSLESFGLLQTVKLEPPRENRSTAKNKTEIIGTPGGMTQKLEGLLLNSQSSTNIAKKSSERQAARPMLDSLQEKWQKNTGKEAENDIYIADQHAPHPLQQWPGRNSTKKQAQSTRE